VRARTTGAAARTAGASLSIASASSGIRVITLPVPKLIPALDAVPGMIMRVLAPMLEIVCFIAEEEPLPISIIVMTAEIPMIIPSIVRIDRMMFLRIALSAVRRIL